MGEVQQPVQSSGRVILHLSCQSSLMSWRFLIVFMWLTQIFFQFQFQRFEILRVHPYEYPRGKNPNLLMSEISLSLQISLI